VAQLLADPQRLQDMSNSASRAARPRAALDIVESILSDIGERQV
jgi:UDP-N-acetylglucosamine:LPS N-acetylglucosamine transferase